MRERTVFVRDLVLSLFLWATIRMISNPDEEYKKKACRIKQHTKICKIAKLGNQYAGKVQSERKSIRRGTLRGQVKFDEWDKKNNPNSTDSTHDLGFYQRTGWRWLMKSASQRHPSRLYNLAGMYLYGVYVEKDFDLAVSMYRLANKIGGTGTRSMDILNKLKVDSEFSEIDDKRLELFFLEWADLETEYSFHSVELHNDYSDLAEEDEIQIISEKTEEYKKSKIKYLLFNRHVIGKYDDDVYVRDLKNHLWEYSHDYTCDYLYENDCVVEEIDYDESNEEIRGLRRAKGHWYCEDAVTACKPSPQVITYLEKTGLKYVDLYGAYGNEEADQQETNTESLFRRFPDLLEGAPGFENWKEKNIN